MANFNIAHEKLLQTQGMYPYFDENNKFSGDHLLCSECFNDEGLRLTAQGIGIKDYNQCVNCGSVKGEKLTKELIRELGYLFFVRGTIERFKYGGFPLIQMNELRESDIRVSNWLKNDVELIEKFAGVGLFYFHPRFWMLGEITPLKSLQNPEEIEGIVERVLEKYPTFYLTEEHPFYRIRLNPERPQECGQYDSPPEGLGGDNRFSNAGLTVLYASPDIEVCIHECRATTEDKLYSAKLIPKTTLKMLNLATLIKEEGVDEFESLDMAIHFLFLAGKHSYPICGDIARRIYERGYDGIIYPSYFSYVRTGAIPFDTILGMSIRIVEPLTDFAAAQIIPNIALFGRPIAEGKVTVKCINRIMLNGIRYEMTFGPVCDDADAVSMPSADYLQMRMNTYVQDIMESFGLSDDEEAK